MRFHEAFAYSLVAQGGTSLFGVLGDGNLFLADSFQRLAGGQFYSMANESAAVLAANGYAATSGKLGLATVTHGPGLTNTVTALVESVRDRQPLVLIAGDTAILDRQSIQNIPQRDVVSWTGAGFEQVRAPQTAHEDLARAIRTALVDRKPVILNVPAEFQHCDVDPLPPVPRRSASRQAVEPDADALDAAVGIIASARRPIVLAGRGVDHPAGRAALLRLADRIGAPVATSLRGKDLFRGTAHDLGIFGGLAHEVASDVIARADTIVAFGAGLNRWTAADGSLLKGKALVHVDTELAALNQWYPTDAALVGDATAVADRMVALLDDAEIVSSGFADLEMTERLAKRSDAATYRDLSTADTVDIRTALLRVDEAIPHDRTLVTDAGRFVIGAFSMVHVPDPTAFVYTMNFGSIGLGLGNAIGAYFGAPDRPVLLLCGDGGLMLGGLAEFNTAARHGVDLIAVVFNDRAYGAEHIQFLAQGMDPGNSMFDWPDFAAVAESLGGRGFTVRNLDELDKVLVAIAHRDRPVLIDIKMDPEKVPDLRH